MTWVIIDPLELIDPPPFNVLDPQDAVIQSVWPTTEQHQRCGQWEA